MNPSFQFDADGLSDLQFLWEDGERVFYRGWRADGAGGRCAALAVQPAAERPPPASLDRLAPECEMKDEFDGAWAARPLTLAVERRCCSRIREANRLGGSSTDWWNWSASCARYQHGRRVRQGAPTWPRTQGHQAGQ